jgi:hypothetical protein
MVNYHLVEFWLLKGSKLSPWIFLLGILFAVSCSKNEIQDEPEQQNAETKASLEYNTDWTFETHGNSDQNYSIVFPQTSVNIIEITLGSQTWGKVRSNMIYLFKADFGKPIPSGVKFPNEETEYVDVNLTFNGKNWKNIGFRLKGNSTLKQSWSQGIYKLPFRLNFDKFEDSIPAIKNQHFYGFEELSFSPGPKDASMMHEKITPELFRMANIPAAQTSFYRVYINFGEGLKYCGLYTAVELPDDHMIKEQFGEESGNIYKPESRFGRFIQTEFEKKNNEMTADYSVVENFITALNSSLRTTSPALWRSNLEAVFNVDHFIRYLAVNNAIVNWDSYGNIAHNFYLYNHSVKKLCWIPWDHNEAMNGSPGITGTPTPQGGTPGAVPNKGLSLSMNEVLPSWPLIRYIVDDEVYFEKYKTYLKSFNETVLSSSTVIQLIDRYQIMISPYVTGPEGEQPGYTFQTSSSSFSNGVNVLKNHLNARRNLISSYVP